MIRACVKYMKMAKHGRIVNASSISGSPADVGLVAYGARSSG
jgi:NAD(P)-dependent dehydrogenase (short-subunit alcohol dehydrogenase family)